MLKKNILLSWLGDNDIKDTAKQSSQNYGAITSILSWTEVEFQEAHLLSNRKSDNISDFIDWLKQHLSTQRNRNINIHAHYHTENNNPTDYQFVYQKADQLIHQLDDPANQLYMNLTSGTPTMCATWLLLGTGVYDAILLQSSEKRGVEYVCLPYNISLQAKQDQKIIQLNTQIAESSRYFKHIPAQSEKMREAVELAQLIAPRNVPVIIQGATGTGKEIIAKAIHQASLRQSKPFVAINCGAIPESLIDTELFGHKKGAFTGAGIDRVGHFEEANGGTLFLDELGELPLSAQVKLLRVLQQKEIMLVGESKSRKIDVRIIAATHRDLLQMVDDGLFREDLFYRLAVGIIHLPSLRERKADILPLTELLLQDINHEFKDDQHFVIKRLSVSAKSFVQKQVWLGNVRELGNTLLRAAVWNPNTEELTDKQLQAAMIQRQQQAEPVCAPLTEPIDVRQKIHEIKRAYIQAALEQANDNKIAAARLLG